MPIILLGVVLQGAPQTLLSTAMWVLLFVSLIVLTPIMAMTHPGPAYQFALLLRPYTLPTPPLIVAILNAFIRISVSPTPPLPHMVVAKLTALLVSIKI
jgi:hypothetical protein